MTEIVSDWLHFGEQPPKRKRAELVCSACHAKKVKCDLQAKTRDGHSTCSICYAAGATCQARPSKRRKTAPSSDTRPQVQGQPLIQIDNNGRQRSHSPASAASGPGQQGAEEVSDAHPPPPAAMQVPPIISHRVSQRPNNPPQHPTGVATSRSNPSDVDTGFLHVYDPETHADAEQQEFEATLESEQRHSLADARQQELQQIYADTYVEFCYPWCPVLDVKRITEDTMRSSLLANALAVAGSHVRPPLIPHDGPAAYYKRATSIFYNDEETDGLTTLQSIALFYWWAPRSTSVAHRHSSWWWTSVLIRHAQQMNFHRDPGPSSNPAVASLRRRIWWTAFARERLTALCQSKPCIIDPSDCSIAAPSMADFPQDDPRLQRKGEIFIHWVSLCAIIGRVAKALSRPGAAFPTSLRQELVDWIRGLPEHLQLPIRGAKTEAGAFDRDVHQLHLPYLTTIIVLHLRRSAHDLPQALPPAILAAACIARILRDILSRGDARFLMAITCWYSGTAFTALLQASRIPALAKDANDGLDVLTNAVEQLERMWGSAKVIRKGFDRLRTGTASAQGQLSTAIVAGIANDHPITSSALDLDGFNILDNSATVMGNGTVLDEARDFDWTILFPFVTPETGGIAKALLQGGEPGMATRFPSPEGVLFQDAFMLDYQGLLEPFNQVDSFVFGDIGIGMGL